MRSNASSPPPPPAQPEVVLDGFVLLEACRCEDPDEAEKAVLEGCGISSVISEDLSFFRKLSHLDLGDNRVPLASLAYLPGLIELHLDCNGLSTAGHARPEGRTHEQQRDARRVPQASQVRLQRHRVG